MSLVLNILWLVFGGLLMAFGWLIAAALMAITIIGLPWAPAAVRIAGYTLLPFGQRAEKSGDAGTLSFLGNVVWFILAGWWLALGHLVIAFGLAITIIGLPFAWAHLKLAGLSLAPVGTVLISD
ncbi:MAG: YccF domain-containing protein [Rhodospirillaceae bacterium]|nr:YccF domain-containing protein [Rhodospirillaceae bacterium]